MLARTFSLLYLVVAVMVAGCNPVSNAADGVAATHAKGSGPLTASAEEEKVLRIRNWPNYLPEGILEEFEVATGIKVEYKTFDSNEGLLALVNGGNRDIDIVVPSSQFGALMIENGWARPLDVSLLPNRKHLDPLIMRLLTIADPGNAHLVPWAWGFVTVGINRSHVLAALGETPMPDNAWDLVFNPAYTKLLKRCGIAFLDSPSEVMPAAAQYAGKAAYSDDPLDHAAAADVIRAVRGDIRRFSGDLIDELAEGKLCVTLGWSGDINQSAYKAQKAGSRDVIEALLPSTGGIAFFDTMLILKDAKRPRNAHAFIDFMLRPENAARVVTEVGYPTGNVAARALVDKAAAGNPSIFMSTENINKLAVPGPYSMRGRSSLVTSYLQAAYDLRMDDKSASLKAQ